MKPDTFQTNRQVAEMIAKFRTHPFMSWNSLADDIETALNARAPDWKTKPAEDWLSGLTPGQIDPKELAEIEKMDEEQKPKDEKPGP